LLALAGLLAVLTLTAQPSVVSLDSTLPLDDALSTEAQQLLDRAKHGDDLVQRHTRRAAKDELKAKDELAKQHVIAFQVAEGKAKLGARRADATVLSSEQRVQDLKHKLQDEQDEKRSLSRKVARNKAQYVAAEGKANVAAARGAAATAAAKRMETKAAKARLAAKKLGNKRNSLKRMAALLNNQAEHESLLSKAAGMDVQQLKQEARQQRRHTRHLRSELKQALKSKATALKQFIQSSNNALVLKQQDANDAAARASQ
jgi:hypothetical protein